MLSRIARVGHMAHGNTSQGIALALLRCLFYHSDDFGNRIIVYGLLSGVLASSYLGSQIDNVSGLQQLFRPLSPLRSTLPPRQHRSSLTRS